MRMKSPGFTLVELMVVLSILGILLAVTAINFDTWQKKFAIEAQVKEMATDVSDVRIRAMQTKRKYRIVLNPANFSFSHYSTETVLSAANFSKTLNHPIQRFSSGVLTPFSNSAIEIDERGYVTNPAGLMTIAVGVGVSEPAYNCLAVHNARVNIGRINGTNCDFK